jgi:hypothetical protein
MGKDRSGTTAWNDSFGGLTVCPGCSAIQNKGDVCVKCGTIFPIEYKTAYSHTAEILATAEEPQEDQENTKVSLMTLRKRNTLKSPPRKHKRKAPFKGPQKTHGGTTKDTRHDR